MSSKGAPNWWVRWTHWEYWPFWVFNTPVIMIWLWYAIRARSLFFFSRVNPGIASGGMMGESKFNILKTIDSKYYPITAYIPSEKANSSYVGKRMSELGLDFPVVLKPDVGERGKRVELIRNKEEMDAYLDNCRFDCLLQSYVDYPEEAAILYYRYPEEEKGHVSSLCIKEKLHVQGDGKRTLRQLMENDPRAAFQIERLLDGSKWSGDEVPAEGEELLLEPIGNHSRGTKFMDGCHLIDERLLSRMDQIHGNQEAVHYARYDLKYKDWESFLDGKDFSIIEVNGVSGEPAHMYDPEHSALYAYRTMYKQWGILLKIAGIQKKRGYKSMRFSDAWKTFQRFNRHQKILKQA
jgi:hypothetical protein